MRKEIQRTYDLHQQEKLDADGFSKFYAPLEERRKQVEVEIPPLEAQVDVLKVNNLSAAEIVSQASNLYDQWQTMELLEKRGIIEVITDKIFTGKDEITINLSYSPSFKDMANRWRKGSFLNPFCQLVIKAVRGDSPPCQNRQSFAEMLLEYRHRSALTRQPLASKLGVSLATLKNWEHGRTKPSKVFWKRIKMCMA